MATENFVQWPQREAIHHIQREDGESKKRWYMGTWKRGSSLLKNFVSFWCSLLHYQAKVQSQCTVHVQSFTMGCHGTEMVVTWCGTRGLPAGAASFSLMRSALTAQLACPRLLSRRQVLASNPISSSSLLLLLPCYMKLSYQCQQHQHSTGYGRPASPSWAKIAQSRKW